MKIFVLSVEYYQMGAPTRDLVCIFSTLNKAKDYIKTNIHGRLDINDQFPHCTYYTIVKFSDHDVNYYLEECNLDEPI